MTDWVGSVLHWLHVTPEWGDVATWVTAAAVLVAWVSLRGEGRRDAERRSTERRRYADQVYASTEMRFEASGEARLWVKIKNAGPLPIRTVSASLFSTNFDTGEVVELGDWRPLSGIGPGDDALYPLDTAATQRVSQVARLHRNDLAELATVRFRFTDLTDHAWERDSTGYLRLLKSPKKAKRL